MNLEMAISLLETIAANSLMDFKGHLQAKDAIEIIKNEIRKLKEKV
jgi:hypothetical protein